MLLAVVAALLDQGIVDYQWIVIGIVVGAFIGGAAARMVQMTAMPEMVALFNGFGGMASLLVGWAALAAGCGHLHPGHHHPVHPDRRCDLYRQHDRLRQAQRRRIGSGAVLFSGQQVVNSLIVLGILGGSVMFCLEPANHRVAVPGDRPVAGVRRDGGHSHRRRRHAGGDFPAELLLGPGGLCRGFRGEQQHPDRGRRPGRRLRHHPHPDHVQGDEPLPGQRAVQRFRQRQGGRDRRRGRDQADLRGGRLLHSGSRQHRGDHPGLRHGGRPGPARGQGTGRAAGEKRRGSEFRYSPGGRPHAGPHERAAGRGRCALRPVAGDGRDQSRAWRTSTWPSSSAPTTW